MEDSPSEIGLQGRISNNRKLRSSKARVVSVTDAIDPEGRTELVDQLLRLGPRRDPAFPADPGERGSHVAVAGGRVVTCRPVHKGDRGEL
jgi:hypothetical protein